MFRKLLFAGAIAGSTAAVPVFFDAGRLLDGSAPSPAGDAILTPRRQDAAAPVQKPRSIALSGRKAVLEADDRGHFTGEFRINGRRVAAMVDTGATLVAINRSTARSIGLSLRQQDFDRSVETANGRTRAAVAMVDAIEIGRVAVRDVPVLVLEDAALNQTLVGMSFLGKLSRFSVENGALVLVE